MFPELSLPKASQFTYKNNATEKCEAMDFLKDTELNSEILNPLGTKHLT